MIPVYHPSPLILPKEMGLKRLQRNLPWHAGLPYDFYTLCFDVFFSLDKKSVFAICPPFRNLYKSLFPLEIFLGSTHLEYELICPFPVMMLYSTPLIIKISLPANFPQTDNTDHQVNLEFRWKNLVQQCRVSNNPFSRFQRQPLDLTLVTVQKNNPLDWIKNWCLFHHRVHGIKHIVIYDNGSDDRLGLNEQLNRLDSSLQVQIIAWDFAYRTGQVGAVNHCHRMLACASRFYLSLDIDEYLINADASKKSLLTKLENRMNAKVPVLKIPGFYVRANNDYQTVLSHVSHFPGKKHIPCPSKLVFFCKGIAVVHVHEAQSLVEYNKQKAALKLRKPFSLYLLLYLKRLHSFYCNVLVYWLWRGVFLFKHRSIFRSKLAVPYSTHTTTQNTDIYFYHFEELNTNWHPNRKNLRERATSVKDERLIPGVKKAKITLPHHEPLD